jgi:DNA-binding MarR family transcriptional regulator
MPPRPLTAESLTQRFHGKTFLHATADGKQRLCIHFSDGETLVLEARSEELVATFKQLKPAARTIASTQPTKRQFEYLTFIAKYIARFGRSPAESDIERHFLVSAPSVNQMMQMLERRGFIARQQGVPRSVRICIDLAQSPQHGTQAPCGPCK